MSGEPTAELGSEQSTALRADLRLIIGGVPVGLGIHTSSCSAYRTEENGKGLEALARDGVLVVSGPTRIGKTSLVNQMVRIGREAGSAPILQLDRQSIRPADAVDAARTIVEHGERVGIQAASPDALLAGLKDRHGLLLVDEFTGALALPDEHAPLLTFVGEALRLGIPTGLVVHAGRQHLESLGERYPQFRQAQIMVPRDLTVDEIASAMTRTAVWSAGKAQQSVSVLRVAAGAADAVTEIAGHKPIYVNQFIREFYQDISLHMPVAGIITPDMIQEFWQRKHMDMLMNSRGVQGRMVEYGLDILREQGELDRFANIFGLRAYSGNRAFDLWESALVAQQESGPEEIAAWQQLGLARRDGKTVAIDGPWMSWYVATIYHRQLP